jgi:hypothetical protein
VLMLFFSWVSTPIVLLEVEQWACADENQKHTTTLL